MRKNKVKDLVKAFIQNPIMTIPNIKMFQKAWPIDFSDSLLELVPENYLDQDPPSIDEIKSGIDKIIRESIAYIVQAGKEDEQQ